MLSHPTNGESISGFIRSMTKSLPTKALAEAAKWPGDVRVGFHLGA
jgi:predicted signal transduction protein with EAL and GGDEF domain